MSGLYAALVQKKIKVGATLSFIGALFIFAFLKKAELFGLSSIIDNYVHDRLQISTFLSMPKISARFNDFSFWREVFEVTLPYLVPLALVVQKDKRVLRSTSFAHAMIMFSSMFGVHVFSKSIDYHYSITIVAPLIFFFMRNLNLNAVDNKKSLIFCILLLIMTSIERYARAVTRPFKAKERACTRYKTKKRKFPLFKSWSLNMIY